MESVKSRIHVFAFALKAEVVELADALRSGRSELTLVRVQIPPSAPHMSGWRNWQTRTFEGRMGNRVGSSPTLDTRLGSGKTRAHYLHLECINIHKNTYLWRESNGR